MTWTVEAVLALLRTVLPNAPERFHLEHDGLRLVIGEPGTPEPPAPSPANAVRAPEPVAPAPVVTPASGPPGQTSGTQPIPDGAITVAAPTVGYFYPRPEPSAPPFVTVGTAVDVGQTLGLVEVMKVFNAVHAPCAGTVHAVLAGDGEFVEHGQALVVIVPDAPTTRAGH